MWFQVEKYRWNTWSDFCSAARRWYGNGRGYQQRLLVEATARMQGNDELARDFITYLLVIIRKMEPILSLEMQLDMLHRNLRPDIQKQVRRSDFQDIDELQEMAREAEMTLEAVRLYRLPRPGIHYVAGGGLQSQNREGRETKNLLRRTFKTREYRR